MKLAIDALSAALTYMVMTYFFNNVFRRRQLSKVAITLLGSLFILVNYAISAVFLHTAVAPMLFLCSVFTYSFLYEGTITKRCLYTSLFYILGILAEILVGLAVSRLNGVTIEETQGNDYLYALCLIMSQILLIILFRLVSLFKANHSIEFKLVTVLPILFIEASSIISIYYLAMVAYKSNNIISATAVFVIVVIEIIANISTFYLLESQVKYQESKDAFINIKNQYKLQKEYYSELSEHMRKINASTHDTRNFIAALFSFIEAGKLDGAKAKIDEYCHHIPPLQKPFTENAAVNALLQSKLKKILDEIPDYTISIVLPENLGVDEVDLCILLGNAIDNAIEACERIANKEKRWLAIKAIQLESQLSILIENSKNKQSKTADSIFSTSKPDKFTHGYGIKSMQNIVDKYDGNIVFEQSDDVFAVSVLIPNLQ